MCFLPKRNRKNLKRILKSVKWKRLMKMGIYANNIHKFVLENVIVEGADGEAIHIENVDHVLE